MPLEVSCVPDPKILLTIRGRVSKGPPKRWAPRRESWYHVVKGKFALTVQYLPWKGYCLRSIRHKTARWNEPIFRWQFPELSVKKVKSGPQASGGTGTHVAAVESDILAKLPNLVAHCAVIRYDDGDPRVAGWWTVQTRGAAWVIVVKDPDSACKLQAVGNSLDDALALADLLLGAEETPWEPDPFLKRDQGRKKKST